MQTPDIETSHVEYFASLTNKYAREIVRWSLDKRRDVDADLRNELNEVIAERVKVNGFRGEAAPTAPVEALVGPLTNVAKMEERVAYAIFGVWWETYAELRDAMHDALSNLARKKDEEGVDRGAPGEFDTFINEAVERVRVTHPSFSEHETRLMAFLTAKQAEGRFGDDLAERLQHEEELAELALSDEDLETTPEGERVFAHILERLESLPVDAPDWDAPLIRLKLQIDEVRARKIRERESTRRLAQELADFVGQHAELLAYFEWQPDQHLPHRDGPWRDPVALDDAVLKVSDQLTALTRLRALPTPATASQEEAHYTLQAELREGIRDSLAALETLAALPQDEATSPPDADAIIDSERVQQLIAERDTYKSRATDAEEKRAAAEKSISELEERNRGLQQDNSRFERENNKLDTDNKKLTGERNTLRSENEALKKRRAIQEEPLNVPYVGPEDAKTVRDAVNLARQHYSDRLDIALNTKSDVDIQFPRPYEAWKALEWLATTYYRYRNQEIDRQEANLMESLKEACTWDYSRTQSSATVKKYWDAYTTVVGKTTFEVREHISKGNTSPNMIRIAFAWDEERQRVIVGFVGHHQETDAS